jgi:hypothetical protein
MSAFAASQLRRDQPRVIGGDSLVCRAKARSEVVERRLASPTGSNPTGIPFSRLFRAASQKTSLQEPVS